MIGLIVIVFFVRPINLSGDESSWDIEYKGVKYRGEAFYCADDDRKFIGHIKNGAAVYTVGNAKDPRYILIQGDDNSGCFIADGTNVPTSGKVTKVLIDPGIREDNSRYLSTDEELDVISEIGGIKGKIEKFEIENYYTDGNSFYYVYDDSNVSSCDNYGGYVAYTNGKWIYSAPSERDKIEWVGNNRAVISGVVIDDEKLISRMCETALTKYIEY
ncbi:MAG: hypothetical protein IKS17_06055 [Firmicutes bacterium]|nr:hypothetical protein [Bacillota bacterium]